MEDVCLLINTCKSYYQNIFELIKQINNSTFNKKNILIISAQENENSISYYEDIKIIKVTYTGLHLTSCIYIQENINEYPNINYWILLPDTIKFGDNFFNKIEFYYENYLKNKEVFSLPFINPTIRPSMDMGILHTKHLINMSNYLKYIKTYQINTENLLNLKKKLIYDENTILGLTPTVQDNSTKFNLLFNVTMPIFFISNTYDDICEKLINDGKINEVYIKNLDLYKFQRNFTGLNKLVMSL
jgi:hypothetical protein